MAGPTPQSPAELGHGAQEAEGTKDLSFTPEDPTRQPPLLPEEQRSPVGEGPCLPVFPVPWLKWELWEAGWKKYFSCLIPTTVKEFSLVNHVDSKWQRRWVVNAKVQPEDR